MRACEVGRAPCGCDVILRGRVFVGQLSIWPPHSLPLGVILIGPSPGLRFLVEFAVGLGFIGLAMLGLQAMLTARDPTARDPSVSAGLDTLLKSTGRRGSSRSCSSSPIR